MKQSSAFLTLGTQQNDEEDDDETQDPYLNE